MFELYFHPPIITNIISRNDNFSVNVTIYSSYLFLYSSSILVRAYSFSAHDGIYFCLVTRRLNLVIFLFQKREGSVFTKLSEFCLVIR